MIVGNAQFKLQIIIKKKFLILIMDDIPLLQRDFIHKIIPLAILI